MPLSQKPAQKRFLPPKRGWPFLRKLFLKKNFQVPERVPLSALVAAHMAGPTRVGPFFIGPTECQKASKMAVDRPFPRGTFKVELGSGKHEVSVIFKPTQSTIVFVNSVGNIRSTTQDLANSAASMKRQLWKPQESWH